MRSLRWFALALLLGAGSAQASVHAPPLPVGGDASLGTVTPTGSNTGSSLADLTQRVLSVTDFGAVCDVQIVTTPGTVSASSTSFVTGSALPASAIGKRIAVFGAAASSGTLFTTISNVVGTTVTLAAAATTATPVYYPTNMSAVAAAGSNYALGDTITDANGMVFTVTKLSGTTIVDAVVTTQSATTSSPSNPRTQSSTSGSGSGATFTISYNATGQFAYGTDDHVALQAAFDTANTLGVNVRLPPGKLCGTTVALDLPANNALVVGSGRGGNLSAPGSGIVALAGSLAAVVQMNGGSSSSRGGGMRDLYVDALLGATDACYINYGRRRNFYNVSCLDGTSSEWHVGSSANGQSSYSHLEARHDITLFPKSSLAPTYSYNIAGVDARYDDLVGAYATTAGMIVGNYNNNQFYGLDLFGGSAFALAVCVDVTGTNVLANLQCGNATTSGVAIHGDGVVVNGLLMQGDDGATGSVHGVDVDSGARRNTVSGCASVNIAQATGSVLTDTNWIVQAGTAGAGNDFECAGAAYSQIGPQYFSTGYGWNSQSSTEYTAYANALDAFDVCYSASSTTTSVGPMQGNCALSVNNVRAPFQMRGTTNGTATHQIVEQSADTAAGALVFWKDRGSGATKATVVTGDTLGSVAFFGYDGTSDSQAASFSCRSEGTIAAGAIPGRCNVNTANSAGNLTEAIRWDSSQQTLLTNAATKNVGGVAGKLQIFSATGGESIVRGSNDTTGASFRLAKSRNTTYGSFTAITTGDEVGRIEWNADDGTNYTTIAAQLKCTSTGTIGTGQVPATCTFSTANSGGTLTSGWTLDSAQLFTALHGITSTAAANSFGASTLNGLVTVGSGTAAAGNTGELVFAKITASGSAPGAAYGAKISAVCGTNAGTAKLIVYGGTSTTPVTIVDNIGSGVTGC